MCNMLIDFVSFNFILRMSSGACNINLVGSTIPWLSEKNLKLCGLKTYTEILYFVFFHIEYRWKIFHPTSQKTTCRDPSLSIWSATYTKGYSIWNPQGGTDWKTYWDFCIFHILYRWKIFHPTSQNTTCRDPSNRKYSESALNINSWTECNKPPMVTCWSKSKEDMGWWP